MTKELRLPDGTYTKDQDKFTEEWDNLRRPFQAMGFRVVGFGPYIALCDAKTGNGYFQLPIYAAKKFIQLSKETP